VDADEDAHTIGARIRQIRDSLAQAELDGITMPATTADTVSMLSVLKVTRALLAVVAGRPDDAGAPMDAATDMANRFGEPGEADPLGFGFGPTNVEFRRVRLALEAGEPDRAVRIAEGLHPEQNPFPSHRVYHWVGYGRALARLRGRHDDAVRALRRAETIHPHRVQRDPMVREALSQLLTRTGTVVNRDRHTQDSALRAGTWPDSGPGPPHRRPQQLHPAGDPRDGRLVGDPRPGRPRSATVPGRDDRPSRENPGGCPVSASGAPR